MRVAIITVGDELLAGDTVNTNATWLCERFAERGVRVERVTTVPDRVADIAHVVNEYRADYDAVVVTGGLGPTHDDLTMEAIAAAVGRETEPHPEAVAWLTEERGYEAGELVEGTTHLPAGARMIRNEEGVAPGAVVGNVYVLPGVPSEMKAMFERIDEEFEGTPTFSERVYTTEPESMLVARFETLQEEFDVVVGSYPGDGVRVKITGTEPETVAEAAAWLRERVELDEE